MKHSAQALPPQVLRSRLGRVCVAIIGDSIADMLSTADQVLKENPFLEFRLDYLADPAGALPRLKKFLYENSVVTAIATCRRKQNGGRFGGTAAAQVEVLGKAADAGCQIVDVELETAESVKKPQIDALRDLAAVILSWHDYKETKGLDDVLARMRKFTPDFYKIVSTARTLSDNVTMIRFLETTRDEAAVIGNVMGEAGIISRVLGVRAGSAFTFAAATPGEETAPGQIAARTLREVYRIDQVDQSTQVYGVAGDPVKHSLSPLMMNTAFRRETVNAVYLSLHTHKVKDLIHLVQGMPMQGLSVTMPLKQEILPYLEKTDAWSEKIGACNTVVRLPDGKLFGYNTDVIGVLGPLESRLSLRGARVLVIGAGGAARAAVFGLRERGAEVWILNRTRETAQKLAREAKVKTIKKEAVAKQPFDVIINATPIGMTGNKQQSWLEPSDLNARYVFDMVYDPVETPLIRAARQKGISVITGVEMFVQQAAEQFQIWTRKPAPRDEMLRVVVRALQQRGEGSNPQLVAKAEPTAPAAAEPRAKVAAKAAAKSAPVEAKRPAPAAKKAVPATKKAAVPEKKAAPKSRPGKAVPARSAKKAPAKKSARR